MSASPADQDILDVIAESQDRVADTGYIAFALHRPLLNVGSDLRRLAKHGLIEPISPGYWRMG